MIKGFRKIKRHLTKGQSPIVTRARLNAALSDTGTLFDLILAQHGYAGQSKAQFQQDIFVLLQTGFKSGGYFVDFGATDGIGSNNSYLLETAFGWDGILAEPARVWHDALKKNRRCAIETDCVWSRTGERLAFHETDDAYLSTIGQFRAIDMHARQRNKAKVYEVDTISLNDLLERHNAPQHIDYLSIDTEGSELDILQAFDWDRYQIDIITCEHNHTPAREQIHALLTSVGYRRVFTEITQVDDWYVRDGHSVVA